MSIYSRYKTDKSAEENGVWVELEGGEKIKVARANCKASLALRRKLEKPYANFSTVPAEASEKIAVELAAQVLVKDWSGFVDEDGKEIPFSVEKARELFTELKDLLNDVFSASAQKETFLAESVTAAKNA